jgi:hypothetical protein
VAYHGIPLQGQHITYDSKRHYLGLFDTKQEAALACDIRQADKRERGEDLASSLTIDRISGPLV